MLTRRTAPQSIAWFLDLHHAQQLDLDPPYQRLSVWNTSYQQYFVDSVLRNYPSPAIFLDVEIAGPGKGASYHVVDGKQRLTAILDYIQDRFQTSSRYSDPDVANKYYSDLDRDQQHQFLRYILPVEFLEGANEIELQEAFDRLNRNVAKLNAQELRNARFAGEFINLMESLADDPFWGNVGIATKARIRRMLDIEYVSEIFLLTMHGIQDGKGSLDEAYALYDEEIPDQEQTRRRYESAKDVISALWPHLNTNRFSNIADFYSLWAAVLIAVDREFVIDVTQAGARLSAFAESVRTGDAEPDAQRYLVAATQGSNKASNRTTRADILFTYLTGQQP